MCFVVHIKNHIYAGVAELADALDLGSSVLHVWVRVPPPVPIMRSGAVG